METTRGFDRRFFAGENRLSRIGGGGIGGKAAGLASVSELLGRRFAEGAFPGLSIGIPESAVVGTDSFDAFLAENRLRPAELEELPDDRIAMAFQRASMPPTLVGDLRALAEEARTPLAVRSSSALEDAMFRPFAGVYATKMIPNNQARPDERFARLVEAVKLVWASTFFAGARRYRATVPGAPADEKMAVLIQAVVGRRFGDRFYPTVSGVARSRDFYARAETAPEDGVVDLALGLGKTIVDGGLAWSYCPARPTAPAPFNGVRDLMRHTQTTYWAVNMGPPPPWDPCRETEHLVTGGLAEAELEGSLRHVASTFSAESERLVPGVGRDGPRVLDFAPLLDGWADVPLDDAVRALLAACVEELGAEVEIEFAVDLDPIRGRPARLGFLQVRPMVVSDAAVDLPEALLSSDRALLTSRSVLGNGSIELADVIYVRPDTFDPARSADAAREVARLNARLAEEGRPYLLVGFGRWGTSDPWRGVPVTWDQISGARAIVEVGRAGMETELSQGSHFFHNVTSFEVLYLSVPERAARPVDWAWLDAQPVVEETRHLRHVRPARPIEIIVDGRKRAGVVVRHDGQ